MATEKNQMLHLVTTLDQIQVQRQGDACCHDEPLRAKIIGEIASLDIPPILQAVVSDDAEWTAALLGDNPYLLDMKVHLSASGRGRWETLLHTAYRAKAMRVFPLLLQKHVLTRATNSKNEPVLRLAVREMDYDTVRTLLQHGASAEDQPSFLHLAFQLNRVENPLPVLNMLALLVAYGGNPTNTPVYCSCGRGVPAQMLTSDRLRAKPGSGLLNEGMRYQHAVAILRRDWNVIRAIGLKLPPNIAP